ncbi:hypothetical protein L1049_022020 [Liquidambar formosana]|uniref:S-locus glycoprotein n=1 Tax=Liquidambar formosana TaxID=63359 RepID=A0AAP0RDT1_LIQFO
MLPHYHLSLSRNLIYSKLSGMSTTPKPCFSIFVIILFLSHKACSSIGGDTLSSGQSLAVSQTLISQESIFELGFFRPSSTNSLNIFLGIWYKNFADRIIVWVANRDSPLFDPSSSRLEISQNGNLVLLNKFQTPIWSTNLSSSRSNFTEAVLLDTGNFVLRDRSNSSTIYWQSFDHPTDTWLPGGKIGINKRTGKAQFLTSWKNSENPAPGMFTFGIDPNGSSDFFMEWNRSQRYWSSGLWDGQTFSSVPDMRLNKIYRYSFVSNENESYFTYSIYGVSVLSRFVMDSSGKIEQLTWMDGIWNWNIFWSQPNMQSEVYALCGAFGVYNENVSTYYCECLKGFEPFSIDETRLNDWSGGCVRKTPLQCENGNSNANGKKDGFLKISNMRQLPRNSKSFPAANARRCELACMENCTCTAYTFNSSGCSIWKGALLNLQLSPGDSAGQDLYIRLAATELGNAGGNRKLWVVIAVLVSLTILISSFLLCCLCLRMHKRKSTYAWELWNNDQGVELLEPKLGYPSSTSLLLRCINIGLLCVEESPADRPTMSNVVSMLGNELAPLPEPKRPAFSTGRGVMDSIPSNSSMGIYSINNITISTVGAR